MKKIETQQDLIAQISYSKVRVEELEHQIKNDFEEIKTEWKPSNIARNVFHDLVMSERGGVLGASVALAVDKLMRNLFFRKSNFITRTIVALVASNLVRNQVSKKSENIFDWIKSVFLKLKTKHRQNGHHQYDESTTGVDWEI